LEEDIWFKSMDCFQSIEEKMLLATPEDFNTCDLCPLGCWEIFCFSFRIVA
jgi:hypothetical protein